jgi:hypothetical protein
MAIFFLAFYGKGLLNRLSYFGICSLWLELLTKLSMPFFLNLTKANREDRHPNSLGVMLPSQGDMIDDVGMIQKINYLTI